MRSLDMRLKARELYASGISRAEISRRLGVTWYTANRWCTLRTPTDDPRVYFERCFRCRPERPLQRPDQYAYLLGQYLGDGHLATSMKVPMLRVCCAATYPDIMDEVEAAMLGTLARSVCRVASQGCFYLTSYSKHWPCLLPQHGPGMKHLRPIKLARWQQKIVDAYPQSLLRAFIHSDGCRIMNRVTVRGKKYSYPRYLFINESTDILRICGDALDRVGAQWRFNRRNSISVAKRDSVALLDSFIGPKS